MKISDIKFGDLLTYRNGKQVLVNNKTRERKKKHYNDDFKHKKDCRYDIMKIQRYVLDCDTYQYDFLTLWERKEKLTEKEKLIKYLEDKINKIKEQIKNFDIWHETGIDLNFLILQRQWYEEILERMKNNNYENSKN